MTYYQARLEEFNEMRAEGMYRASIRVVLPDQSSVNANVIKTPTKRRKPIQGSQGPYVPDLSSIFDILRTDFQAMQLGDRKQFLLGAETWEINEILDDQESEPTIQFRAEKRV
jgi:hypothetical protein